MWVRVGLCMNICVCAHGTAYTLLPSPRTQGSGVVTSVKLTLQQPFAMNFLRQSLFQVLWIKTYFPNWSTGYVVSVFHVTCHWDISSRTRFSLKYAPVCTSIPRSHSFQVYQKRHFPSSPHAALGPSCAHLALPWLPCPCHFFLFATDIMKW